MKIALNQNPFFYLANGMLKAQVKQGNDTLEYAIETKPFFYQDSLSLWQNIISFLYRLFKKPFKWVEISIQDGPTIKTAYVLKDLFERQDFKQIVKKGIKEKEKQAAKKKPFFSKPSSVGHKKIDVEQKDTLAHNPIQTAPMLYALDRVRIDKAISFEELRLIAIKYLKLENKSADSIIIDHIVKRLDELKKDPFGKHEKEVLHTLNIKYLNAKIPHLEISLKDIQEAVTSEQKYELLKKALHLPKDASFKMIEGAFNRLSKQLYHSKDPLSSIAICFLKQLMDQADKDTQTA